MRDGRVLRRGASGLLIAASRLRAVGYERGILQTERVPGIQVISVGNLRTGGSGKTPLVYFLVEMLRNLGARPAVISRGYRGALAFRGGTVSLGAGPLVSVREAGDEPFLAATRLQVPVFVGRDRVRSVRQAVLHGCSVAVLDDGFSYRRLHRDLDILSVSPVELSGGAAHLLREPPEAAARAHLLCGFCNDYSEVSAMSRSPDFTFAHTPVGLVDAEGRLAPLPVSGKAPVVFLLSGIARPERFAETAKSIGFQIAGKTEFRDHHFYSARDRDAIYRAARAAGAASILTTEKDLVRLDAEKIPFPTVALRVETRIVTGKSRLLSALDAVLRGEVIGG